MSTRFEQAINRFAPTFERSLGSPAAFREAAVDSRKVRPGNLFAALPGRHADGHAYLMDAYEAGASVFLVDAERIAEPQVSAQVDRIAARAYVLVVSDVLTGLQGLAAGHLDELTGITRIGITGSNGKTSTKEMLASILEQHAPTFRSSGNLNSDIGVPLSALAVSADYRFAVFEMAMDHPGEMERLAEIVRPHYALVTNTGEAHTEFVGSREGVAREKRMIFSQLTADDFLFVPADDECAEILAEPYTQSQVPATLVRFGRSVSSGFEGFESKGLSGGILYYRGMQMRVPIPGEFIADNALAAIAVAEALGMTMQEIRVGLALVVPLFGRGEVYEGPVTVVSDCYNANPQSMFAALDMVCAATEGRRLVLVLGDMKELADPETEHRLLGEKIASLPVAPELVVLVGDEIRHTLAAARGAGCGAELLHFRDVQSAAAAVSAKVKHNDLVLLKGSRSIALEALLEFLGVEGSGHVS